MNNPKSIFLVSAFYMEKVRYSESVFKTQSFTAFFTNLKLIYSRLSGRNLRSYSTFSKYLNKKGYYCSDNINITINNQKFKCRRIVIRKKCVNTFYRIGKAPVGFSVERLLLREMGLDSLSNDLLFEYY